MNNTEKLQTELSILLPKTFKKGFNCFKTRLNSC